MMGNTMVAECYPTPRAPTKEISTKISVKEKVLDFVINIVMMRNRKDDVLGWSYL